MNTHAVYESVRTLPADSVAYGPKTRPLEAHQRWAAGINDPHWGWRIAFGYHQSQEPLPPSIRDQYVRRAYHYLEDARDDQMAIALAIRTSMESGTIRSVLQGFLCARDISLEGIASLLNLDLDAVNLYEGLFFNVRNREGAFAINTIFPQTRVGAVREAELDYNEVDLIERIANLIKLEKLATLGPRGANPRIQKALAQLEDCAACYFCQSLR